MEGFSHIGISVREGVFQKTLDWYLAALAPLGYKVMMRPVENVAGLGAKRGPEFWIGVKDNANEKNDNHIAFFTPKKELVNEFHAAALKAGGTCNGPPGLRPEYAKNYYGAFAFDPVGNNVEVMLFLPEGEESTAKET